MQPSRPRLLHRERTGEGQHLDISLLDAYFHYHDMAVEMVSASHGERRVERIGNQIGALSPAGNLPDKNRIALWIFAFQDNHWARLCRMMGREDLISDPRSVEMTARVANRKLVNGAINEWLMQVCRAETRRSASLREARIPHAPVLTVEEAMNHPHMIERGTVRTVHDRVIGDFQIPGMPLRFSAFPQPLELEAPLLGEHNRQVLTDATLGYSSEEIEHSNVTAFSAAHPH